MADLTDVITDAVHDVEDGILPEPTTGGGSDDGGSSDPVASGSESGEASAPAEVSPSSGAAASASATTPPADAPKPVEPDDLTKELEGFGIAAPVPGQREGRFTWSKVRKVLDNTRKKLNDQHATVLKEKDATIATATARLKNLDMVDHMIVTDPDKYIRTLARIHPDKYGKYVGQATGTPDRPTAAGPGTSPTDPAPPPDAEFADGSRGYSPDGLNALLEWHAKRIESSVTDRIDKQYSKRFGPIEQDWKAQRFVEQKLPVVRSAITAARQTWGKPFDEHEGEIVALMNANDGQEGRPYLSFDACIAQVLVPKTKAERNAMRADLLKEINGRPAAAARTGPTAVNASSGATDGPRNLEDVIRQQIAALPR